jgi:hypothetical protein
MGYKKWLCFFGIIAFIGLSFISVTTTSEPNEKPIFIPSSPQRIGDAKKGYQYLINGDYLKSGLPFALFKFLNGKEKHNYLNRSGKNAQVPHGFNVVSSNGVDIVVPTCLQCHAQEMGDSLVVGLGNSFLDFTNIGRGNGIIKKLVPAYMQTFTPADYAATKDILRSMTTISPLMETEVRGVNTADRLATLLVAHRDPITLEWQKTALLIIPDEVIPTDVPAWWLLKKKNAMFYNGFGRGDFGKFLMLSNILTVKDTTEAREVFSHFGDVLAYILSIQPPKYPYPVDEVTAAKGKDIYITNCSKCHGTYGSESSYPNMLIPESIIQTDSMLFKSNHQNPQFIEWFNKSWFAQGDLPARLVPSSGYVAPPLDGIWATSPYLHNGSVPTLETLLNSRARPKFWKRNFQKPSYDFHSIGWEYETLKEPIAKKTYNTTIKGYSNKGHYFGDHLSTDERKALIEYLKTL